jgi:lysozyme
LLKLLNAKLYEKAAAQFPRWISSHHTVMNGLIARRVCEQALFLNRLILDKNGNFNRDLCSALGAAPPSGKIVDIEEGEKQ